MMIVEIILIVLSINGIGFELQMLENRITMFLLHFYVMFQLFII